MSRVTELAEAEARRAEAEEPDDGNGNGNGGDEKEPTGEPEAIGEVEAEQIGAAVDKANKAYRTALGKIAGLSFEHFEECHECNGVGFMPPGAQPPAEIQVAKDKEQCGECAGFGVVLTGARNEQGQVWQCSTCGGNGWVPKAAQPQPLLPNLNAQFPGNQQGGQNGTVLPMPAELPGPDAWGRPWGHADYGLHPATVNG